MEERQIADAELTGSLVCTLLDRRSSVPLIGARITCVGHGNRVTRYDADRSGSFSAKLPQGTYDLVISARGYLSLLIRGIGVLGGHEQTLIRALIPGQGDQPQCDPATAIGGYITDRFARALSNLTVKITSESGQHAYTTRTDREGAYVVNSVTPDMYDLAVSIQERRIARELVPIASHKDFVRLDLRLLQL
jgi:hypothetical protein